MMETLCHSYEELQQQISGYALTHVSLEKDGKLGPRWKSTGRSDPSCKIHSKALLRLKKGGEVPQQFPRRTILTSRFIGGICLNRIGRKISKIMDAAKSPLEHIFNKHKFYCIWCKQKIYNK
eukprot:4946404-Ditylum_brightwellii.AAC.1